MKYLIMSLFLAPLGFAEEMSINFPYGAKCSVEVISSVCASGKVEVEFGRGRHFQLDHGDVRCWFVDFQLKGALQNPRRNRLGGGVTVDLVLKEGDKVIPIGELDYRKKNDGLYKTSLATLKIFDVTEIRSNGGHARRYHLKCEDHSGIDCQNFCLAQGGRFMECHSRCGLW